MASKAALALALATGVTTAAVYVVLAPTPATGTDIDYYRSVVRVQKGPMTASGVNLGNGLVLTANHVTSYFGPGDWQIEGASGSIKVLWSNKATELGLLKVDSLDAPAAAPDCSTGDAAIGDEIEAIGNPLGFRHVHTFGHIASDTAHFYEIDTDRDLQIGNIVIAPGMSGGGIFHDGKLMGITSAMLGQVGTSLGFIVPKSVICKDLAATHPAPEVPTHGPVVGGSYHSKGKQHS